VSRRRIDRRGRPRKAGARRRATTLAGRAPPLDLGTDELRRRKRHIAAGREDLELNGAGVLLAYEHLNRQKFDTLGTITQMLQRVARAWGGRDGNVTGLWMAITSALIATGYAPTPVGDGGFGLADGARRRLQRVCRSLDGSRALVIELAEGKVPELVLHVLDHALTRADTAALERLRQSLDDIAGERRNRNRVQPSA
jgi:hypothetical protein